MIGDLPGAVIFRAPVIDVVVIRSCQGDAVGIAAPLGELSEGEFFGGVFCVVDSGEAGRTGGD